MIILKMNFFYHLKEIKIRLIYILFCFFITFIFSYLYVETFIFLMVEPLNANFIFMTLFEGFYCFFFTAFLLTCFFTFFFFCYSIFDFLKPGLIKSEKSLFLFMIKLEINISFLAIFFSYNLFLPFTINFLLSFEQNKFDNFFNFFFQPNLLDYIHFFFLSVFIFFFFFQFPLFVFLAVKTQLVGNDFFIKFRREFIFFFLLTGCLFSPPDFFSQILVALPICFLYEIIIFWFVFNNNFWRVARMERGEFAKL